MRFSKFSILQILGLMLILSACQRQSAESGKSENERQLQQANASEQQQEQNEQGIRIMPGHIVMMATDLDQTQQFYEEHLNFHTNEEVIYDGLRRIFMSASDNHHELVLLESRVEEFPPIEQRQLQQVAFEVPTHDILTDYYNHIKQTDIPHVIMDNQVSLSIYFPDPNDVTVEIYWDISDQPFGEQMWNGNQIEISEEKFLNPFEKMGKQD